MLFHREALTAIRECRGLTKSELARRADITPAYQTQLEGGVREEPSHEIVARFAAVLDVPPEALYQEPTPAVLLKELARANERMLKAAAS